MLKLELSNDMLCDISFKNKCYFVSQFSMITIKHHYHLIKIFCICFDQVY